MTPFSSSENSSPMTPWIAFIKNPTNRPLLLGLVSLSLLITALGFQYLGALMPCTLCIWQRWPHLIAGVLGIIAWKLKKSQFQTIASTGAFFSILIGLGISLFHVGVEIGVWNGLASCSMMDFSGSPEQILNSIEKGHADCGEISWTFLGHSMAAWNLYFNAALSGLWLGYLFRTQK